MTATVRKLAAVPLPDQLPVNEEAEQAVIGGLLLAPEYLPQVDVMLGEADFHSAACRAVWVAITTLVASGQPVDLPCLLARLEADGTLDRVGGIAGLSRFSDHAPNVHRLPDYARVVRRYAISRLILDLTVEISQTIQRRPDPDLVRDHLARAMKALDEGAHGMGGGTLRDQVDSAMARYAAQASGKRRDLVRTGFPRLDDEIGGFARGDWIVIGGVGGAGKTTFTEQMVMHQIVDGERVLFVSLEMSASQTEDRMFQRLLGAPARAIRGGRVPIRELEATAETIKRAAWSERLALRFPPTTELVPLLRAVKAEVQAWSPTVVVIDHLHRITHAPSRGDKRLEVSAAAAGLKELARQLEVPVVSPAQCGRENQRLGQRPRKWNLIESSKIDQEADGILMLHRPDTEEPSSVLVDKWRQGDDGFLVHLAYDNRTRDLVETHWDAPAAAVPSGRGRRKFEEVPF